MVAVVGIDEVGRGSWAGPLVAAAVILAQPINGLKDSKKLSKLQRVTLAKIIHERAVAIGIGWVSASEIDEQGLTRAVGVAMERALQQITIPFDEIIIDGNLNYFPDDIRAHAVIKADENVPVVSAASIVAKVARDRWMIHEAARQFPKYQFERHVGYGTGLHLDMLKIHGACSLHRLSYKPIQVIMGL